MRRGRSAGSPAVCAALLALAWAPPELGAWDDSAGPMLDDLRAIALPDEVAHATDVRWLAEDEVLLGVIDRGLYSWRIGTERVELKATLARTEHRLPGRQSYSRVGGASRGAVAVANGAFGVFLQEETGIRLLKDVEIVGDVDRRGRLTAAVGLARTEDRGWEDHIAWLFHDDEDEARALLPTRDAGLAMARCYQAGLSVVRFLSEDRLLVAPGAEPGLFVYDRNGLLLDSFNAELFSADTACEIGDERRVLLAQAPYRVAWLNERRVIDEIVADGVGNTFFFVRHVSPGVSSRGSVPSSASAPSPVGGGTAKGGTKQGVQASPLDGLDLEGLKKLIEQTEDGEPVVVPVRNREEAEEAMTWLHAEGGRVVQSGSQGGPIVVNLVQVTPGPGTESSAADSLPADAAYPPSGRVCWDLVYARVDDFGAVARLPCAIESERSDARLRADLRAGRAVILLRSESISPLYWRPSEIFEARLSAPKD